MDTVKFSLRAPVRHAGRVESEPKHKYRSDFMRDRDKILYSKAFRRLASKTQIFVIGFDDHARNRLTHTLEVSQIARTIAQNLKMDLDLTEAIALGHDLGHTPFGHVGERTLNLIMNGCDPLVRDYCNLGKCCLEFEDCDKGFKHNLQSVRIAVDLESPGTSKTKSGMNLTNFTLFGLRNHSKLKWKECKYEDSGQCFVYPKTLECENDRNTSVGYYNKYQKFLNHDQNSREAWSFEAFIVAWADEIAQRHHDMEDAIEGKLMTHEEAVELLKSGFSCFFTNKDKRNFTELKKSVGTEMFLPRLSRFLVNLLVTKLLEASIENIHNFAKKHSLKTNKDFEKSYYNYNLDEVKSVIGLSGETENSRKFSEAHDLFEEKLRNIVLNSYNVHRMDGKAQFIIRRLFKAYLTNPQQLPDKTIVSLFREFNSEHLVQTNVSELRHNLEQMKKFYFNKNEIENKDEGFSEEDSLKFRIALLRVICDYIAGMTDSFALKEFKSLYS